MTAIWQNDGAGWRLIAPTGFPDEAALHLLVEQAPQVLPLAGSPTLTVLGREVALGSGYADLVAVESSGRPVVIEVKLAQNAEARRAVVAQILAYAANLKGTSVEEFEGSVLRRQLATRGFASVIDAVRAADQEGAVDTETFLTALAENLASGRFRLVLVLDSAPVDLVRLVGYLESITDHLVIDLVTIAAYQIDGSQVIVPQRVEPERVVPEPSVRAPVRAAGASVGREVERAADFAAAITDASEAEQPRLRQLHAWAVALEQEGLARLTTYHGVADRLTLLPRIPSDGVGLVTIWNDRGQAYLQFWRSVFVRRAPRTLARLEQLPQPVRIGQGTSTKDVSESLLQLLTESYREAATNR